MMRVIGEGFALLALGALAYWLVFESPDPTPSVTSSPECHEALTAKGCREIRSAK